MAVMSRFRHRRLAVLLLTALLCGPALPLHAQGGTWTEDYHLTPGDEIALHVIGEDDMSGPLRVNADGSVIVPLAGPVAVVNMNTGDAAAAVAAALGDGYLKTPRVSVTMNAYRPFYFVGGVKEPGEYPYREDLTVLQAVSMGGGFAHGGHGTQVEITRRCGDYDITRTFPIDGVRILPGDVLRVTGNRSRYRD